MFPGSDHVLLLFEAFNGSLLLSGQRKTHNQRWAGKPALWEPGRGAGEGEKQGAVDGPEHSTATGITLACSLCLKAVALLEFPARVPKRAVG